MPKRPIPTAATLLLVACLANTVRAVTQCPAGTSFESGLDVSEFQGTITWTQVSGAGIAFTYAKATEGLTYVDSTFSTNWPAMKTAGVIRGAYHFFHPEDDGKGQADAFIAEVKAAGGFQPGDLPPMLDWEFDDCPNGPAQGICPGTAAGDDTCYSISEQIASAQAFLDEVKTQTGVTPVIYTFEYFWDCLGDPSQFSSYPLWFAEYPSTANTTSIDPPSGDCPDTLAPWTGWAIWQWSSTGSVAGIQTDPVDMDVFNGNLEQLQQFGFGGTTPPATCPNGDGTYCSGDGYSGTVGTLYQCAGGTFTTSSACPAGCAGSPPGGHDACNSEPIAQVSGNDAISAVNWPDGHVDVFSGTLSGDEQHCASTPAGTWAAPATLGAGVECGSAAASWGGAWNYPELFSPLASGATGSVSATGTGWQTYLDFGGMGSPQHLSTTVTNDGRADVFGLGIDTAIWVNTWNAGTWSGWTSLGGTFATGVGAITWGNGTVEIFGTDGEGAVWHMWSDMTGSANWSVWTLLGGPPMASRPVPVRWADGMDGHAEIFARGVDGHLYHSDFSYQTDWPALTIVDSVTPLIGEVSAIMNPGGSGATQGPEVFARDATGNVVHLSWSGSAYSGFTPIEDQVAASDPFGWLRSDGSAEVFAIDPSGKLVEASRRSSAGWTTWSTVGAGFDPCAGADGGTPTDGGSSADGGSSDAGMRLTRDGGGGESQPSSGCGCGSIGDSSATLVLLAAGLLRRRVRRPRGGLG